MRIICDQAYAVRSMLELGSWSAISFCRFRHGLGQKFNAARGTYMIDAYRIGIRIGCECSLKCRVGPYLRPCLV